MTHKKIIRQNGKAVVIMSLEDWEHDQETLYVLQNKSLMRQIVQSLQTHQAGAGSKRDVFTMPELSSTI